MISPKLEGGAEQRIANDFVNWMKLKLSKDAPYNREIVDQIIRARGTGTGDPALLWKLACFSGGDDGPAIEFANRVSRHFLGIRLRCAQCHDHPFAQWKEKNFYQMAAFFGRTQAKGGADVEVSESGTMESIKAYGGTFQPQFIYGQRPGKTDPWMDTLAMCVTTSDNLASATANRVWSWLFGRGLVHPVDDFNDMNKPLGGGLLGVLAKEFRSSKFSIKALYRGICNSDTYQRSSANDASMARPNFSAGWIKHLDAEQLMNSIAVATGQTPRRAWWLPCSRPTSCGARSPRCRAICARRSSCATTTRSTARFRAASARSRAPRRPTRSPRCSWRSSRASRTKPKSRAS